MSQAGKGSRTWLWAGVVVGVATLGLGIYIATSAPAGSGSSGAGGEAGGGPIKRYTVPLGSAPTKGPADALVTIVEFSDFQCPHCRVASQTLQRLFEQSPGDVRLVFRHSPLSSHRYGVPAAAAAMAAYDQGQFWEYHDQLFAHQGELGRRGDAYLRDAARALRLDIVDFDVARDRHEHGGTIRADRRLFSELRQAVVPCFFVNGRRLRGAVPLEQFVAVVAEERERARAALARGVPLAGLYEALLEEGAGAEGLAGALPSGSEDDGGPACGSGQGPEPACGGGDGG